MAVVRLCAAAIECACEAQRIEPKRIGGATTPSGLQFSEDWAEPNVDKGPLPALFLRLAAKRMEARPEPLGLYLGSDEPINASNLFLGDQANSFASLKAQQGGSYQSFVEAVDRHVAMYPDYASAQPCVTCHNEHPDSPKTDWKLGDMIGATTWTYPEAELAPATYVATIEAFYRSVEEAYSLYLSDASRFSDPVLILPPIPIEP